MQVKIWNLSELLKWSEEYLKKNKIALARLEAELLIAHLLKIERIQIYTQFDRPLNQEELDTFKAMLKRRKAAEPLAYILGSKEFYNLKFKVNPHVLIPRPETEELVELILEDCRVIGGNFNFVEFGIGSGCIGITLLKNFTKNVNVQKYLAIDISAEALACAQENAAFHGVLNFFEWEQRDFRKIDFKKRERFDVLIANLPYVDPGEQCELAPEVLGEPEVALFADKQGFALIEAALDEIPHLLKINGHAYFEIGYQHRPLIEEYFKVRHNFSWKIVKDLSDHDRMLKVEWHG